MASYAIQTSYAGHASLVTGSAHALNLLSTRTTQRGLVSVLADKAYDSASLRRTLAAKNIKAIIPNRCNRKQPYSFDSVTYKRRNVVERTFCRLKDFRRFATRYDRLASTFLAAACIAAIVAYWL